MCSFSSFSTAGSVSWWLEFEVASRSCAGAGAFAAVGEASAMTRWCPGSWRDKRVSNSTNVAFGESKNRSTNREEPRDYHCKVWTCSRNRAGGYDGKCVENATLQLKVLMSDPRCSRNFALAALSRGLEEQRKGSKVTRHVLGAWVLGCLPGAWSLELISKVRYRLYRHYSDRHQTH